MKSGGPLLGYNNNIPYKGHVYHVQTEDSGAKRPHVITHLFADGGRIVSTTKTSYTDYVGAENAAEKVRGLMRDQHKKMVISLRDGEFDHLLDGASPPQLIEGKVDAITTPAPTSEAVPASVPPSAPLELLEEVAAEDDEFMEAVDEMIEPEERDALPASGHSPGSYSFVGSRSSPPGSSSYPPPSSSPPTLRKGGTPPAGSALKSKSDAPPAVERAGPHRRRRSNPQAGAGRRTNPDDAAVAHASKIFGERYTSERGFDELVVAWVKSQIMR